jgi:hypothetical protein
LGSWLAPSRVGGRPGRSLSFNTKIQFNGNLLVGKAYTAQLGPKPGDEFEIKLGRKQIQLIPPAPVRVLKAAGETDQVIGNTTSSANVSVGLHTLPFISREWVAVWVDQRARSPNRVSYHSAVGRHLSNGNRDAATSAQHRIVLIGRWLGRDAKLLVVLAEAVDPGALFIGSLHSS